MILQQVFLVLIIIVLVSSDETLSDSFSQFLKEYSDPENGFVYDSRVDDIRTEENNMNHLRDVVYLDYTGSGLYQGKQIDKYLDLLKENLFGNTHSRSNSSRTSEKSVEDARERILEFLNTTSEDYSVIFTSGATGALKIISESFPWSEESLFIYSRGIRQMVIEEDGDFRSISEEEFNQVLSNESPVKGGNNIEVLGNLFFENSPVETKQKQQEEKKHVCNLFAYPSESNFSGKKYSLDWINKIIRDNKRRLDTLNNGDWYVLVDAAAFVPTNQLDLHNFPADFVTISFYKMFGFPTGVGALIVKNSVAGILRKRYFGGGTVEVASCATAYCKFKKTPSGLFEDGSINFLSIAALKYGFDALDELGIRNITQHVNILTLYLFDELSKLRHSTTGSKVIVVYGNHPYYKHKQGSIISFNVILPDGETLVGHESVMHKASEEDIHIRSGHHCNPGAVKIHLGWTESQFLKFAGEEGKCGYDNLGFQVQEGVATGSVRVSLGYLTTFSDVHRFLEFVKDNYVE